jgi:hypothetical protein
MSQEIKNSLFKKLEIISPFYHKKKLYLRKKLTFYHIKSYFLLEVQQNFCVLKHFLWKFFLIGKI